MTGVQTCALPIYQQQDGDIADSPRNVRRDGAPVPERLGRHPDIAIDQQRVDRVREGEAKPELSARAEHPIGDGAGPVCRKGRTEERRGGREGRSRWSPAREKAKEHT